MQKISLWSAHQGPHLRGANIYQRRIIPSLDGDSLGKGAVGPPYTVADLRDLAAQGANLVVISHPGVFAENPPYDLDQSILDNLDRLVRLAEQMDLFIVIAFRTGPGRSEFTFFYSKADTFFPARNLNDQVWVDGAAQKGWERMWEFVAAHYRNHPAVIGYELMVEPNANHVCLGEHEPLAFVDRYESTSYDWNRLYPKLVAAVRRVDDKMPVLVGPMSYASTLWLPELSPSSDSSAVHVVHQYTPYAFCHQDPSCVSCAYPGECDLDGDARDDRFDRHGLDRLLSSLDDYGKRHGALLAVTELGASRWAPGAAQFLEDELDLLDTRGLSWAYWVFPPAWPRPGSRGEFDMGRGEDSRSDLPNPASPLLEVLMRHFSLNERRPSNTPIAL